MRNTIRTLTASLALAPAISLAHPGVHEHGVWTVIYHPLSGPGALLLLAAGVVAAARLLGRVRRDRSAPVRGKHRK